MTDLRAWLPLEIVRGAAMLPGRRAVGLVGGGLPALELLDADALGGLARAYRQLLLGLHTPLHIYELDQPLDLSAPIARLLEAQVAAAHPAHAVLLGELADRLATAAGPDGLRRRTTVWVVPVAAPALPMLRRRDEPAALLAAAAAAAGELAQRLQVLGGRPTPAPLEAEAIARLWHGQLDPVRAARYPLAGDLLERLPQPLTSLQEHRHEHA